MTRLPVTERAFQDWVLELATRLRYISYHTWTSIHSAPGFPDCVLLSVERKRLVFAELKMDGKEPTPAQAGWLGALRAVGAEAYCWHWSDRDEIAEILQRGG